MALIPFPDIPQFPGVPTLPRAPGSSLFPITVPTLNSDDPSLNGITSAPQWGLFDGATPVVQADSVISFEDMKEYRVCDYPVEPGSTDQSSGSSTQSSSFSSYNKVEMPYDVRITFAKGGTDSDRAQFLAGIDIAASDTNLYDVVTPDALYTNANVVRYNYSRTSTNGVSLLLVEVFIRQIRTTGTTTFSQSNTADPGASDTVHGGTVYPQTPTTVQNAAAANGAQ